MCQFVGIAVILIHTAHHAEFGVTDVMQLYGLDVSQAGKKHFDQGREKNDSLYGKMPIMSSLYGTK